MSRYRKTGLRLLGGLLAAVLCAALLPTAGYAAGDIYEVGEDSAYTVGLLLERELIEEAGRLSVPGRPVLLRTTKTFLRSFGLSDLDELPTLPDLSKEGEQTTLDLKAAIHRLEEEQELEAGTLPEQMP